MGILDNLENSWDIDSQSESSPIPIIDNMGRSTSAWQESIAINWTANQYIMFSGNPSGTDVLSVIHYMIEKL